MIPDRKTLLSDFEDRDPEMPAIKEFRMLGRTGFQRIGYQFRITPK